MLCESDGSGNPLDIPMDKDCNVQRGSDSERNSPISKILVRSISNASENTITLIYVIQNWMTT
jgi:hypothetical protein